MVVSRSIENDVRSTTIAQATRLFAAHGFDGTALQDIANAVGVTKPAILHHFPSKEHIRQAVLEGIFEHWNKILPRLLLAATAGTDRFDAVFGELHRFFAADPNRARLLVRESLDRPGELRKLLRGVRPWLSAVAQYVRSGRESGRHHADIDDEAYVLHILQFVIAAAACASASSAVLESNAGGRYDRELARIARSSLFLPRSEPKRTSAGHLHESAEDYGAKRSERPPARKRSKDTLPRTPRM
jgi:AcrR family transcriptional regulator